MKTFSIQDYYSIGGKEKALVVEIKKELSRGCLLNSPKYKSSKTIVI